MNDAVTGLRCVLCSGQHPPQDQEGTCPNCGPTGILDVEYDYDRAGHRLDDTLAGQPESLWRYRPLLPVPQTGPLPPLAVGGTPVYDAPRLAKELGLRQVRVKDDGRNPTASFKDRASAIAVTRARALGATEIACASTGNAASSLAGFAAATGLRSRIFVPATAPEGKVAQLLIYGAEVFVVDDSYDAAYDLCQAAVEALGWYNRNCAVNPYLVEGKKTCGLEIGEQTGSDLPDVVAVAVGDGCTIAGIEKGLREMRTLGIINRTPRLLGVQADGAAPLAKAFAAGTETLEPIVPQTLADSIAVGVPRNAVKALRAVRRSGGTFVTVSDEAILEAVPRLAQGSGVFAEPTAAAALAGVQAARNQALIDPDESVLVVATGHGLKDVAGALKSVRLPRPRPADLREVRRAFA